MSTVDPAAARRERFERHRGTTGAAIATVLSGVLVVATGAVAGFGFAGFLDTFRLMELNSVLSTWDSQVSSPFIWQPIGVVSSISASVPEDLLAHEFLVSIPARPSSGAAEGMPLAQHRSVDARGRLYP